MKRKTDAVMASLDLREPWVWSMLCVMLVPVLPEYGMIPLAVLSLLFAKKDAKRRRQRLRVGKAGAVMLAYIVYMTIRNFFVPDIFQGAMTLGYWYAAFAVYVAFVTVLSAHERFETALFLLTLTLGVLGAVAVMQYVCNGVLHADWMPLQLWNDVDKAVYEFLGLDFDLRPVGLRSSGTFTNPNLFAQYLLMAMPFATAFSFSGERSVAKVIGRVCTVLGLAGLFFTFSRGALLAIVAVAIVMCIANIRRLIPILMVVVSVVMLLPDSIYTRISSMGNTADVAIIERFDVWGVTMDAFLENPLFGHGFGHMWWRYASWGYSAPHAHNLFLHFLAEGGIVGLGILIFLIWKLFRHGFELVIHTPKTRMFGGAIIAFVGGVCVCGMVDYLFATPKPLTMFMTVLAVTDALGILEMKNVPRTIVGALPLADRILPRLETWVKRKTAPKGSDEGGEQ